MWKSKERYKIVATLIGLLVSIAGRREVWGLEYSINFSSGETADWLMETEFGDDVEDDNDTVDVLILANACGGECEEERLVVSSQ